MPFSFADLGCLARAHFADAALGDNRRSKRLVTMAGQILSQPRGTLPTKIADPYQLDAAYRFFRSPGVSPDAIQAPHRRRTREELDRFEGVVLIAHDGTELNFTSLAVPGLGVLGGKNQRGFVAHNSLAVTESGEVLGLLHQILFTPKPAPRSDTKSKIRRDPDKLSNLWRDAVEVIGPPPAGKRWVHLADRGADITEFLDFCDERGWEYVVRAHHDRNVEIPADPDEWTAAKLKETLGDSPELGRRMQTVGGGKDRPPRRAELAVSARSLRLKPPKVARGRERGVPLAVTAIRVWEVNPPEGEEPVEWLLLTPGDASDAESAWRRAEWYAKRWTIEEYHKGMKTGLNLESLQLESKAGLQNALALLSVAAVLLVMVRELARDEARAAEPARNWVPTSWVDTLSAWRHRGGPGRIETVRDWVLALARLGGHQYQTSRKNPGWLTLLRGWNRLLTLVEGWELQTKCGGS